MYAFDYFRDYGIISALYSVYSVLWFTIAFISGVVVFIVLGVDYIALILLIVYVGARAILFLFVIMMLNLTDLRLCQIRCQQGL